ncbi:dynein heavy chain [Mycotypha africana]|uniref:dynein heavy chain n=1 Tax=Mycotypha africana TaxID=64632 RepID=UPI0023010469|nr:dynein heavy chain [Mycotypha africana]KAI8967648.1 dynein heavy chain [Mycotypha africana]
MLDENSSFNPSTALSAQSVTSTPTEPLLVFDHRKVQDYLEQLLPLVLGAELADLENTLFSYPDTVEKFKRFANDPQTPVIFIMKEKEGGKYEDDDTQSFSYTASHEITYLPTHVGSIAIIKRVPSLDPSKPLQSQLQLLNLPGAPSSGEANSAYEFLHSYIHLAVSPYFNAYVNARHGNNNKKSDINAGKGGATGGGSIIAGSASSGTSGSGITGTSSINKNDDNKMGVPMAKKKMAELELSLLHLQQNVEIPEISLNIHPVVQRAVDKCREQNKRVTVEAVDSALFSDSSFLNKLQSDVNGWIKEIQKVTKMSRDPASGTAIQEINFWLSMERALEKIDEQLKSDHITLTLDILKHAKRFHATVSFIADTGLKEGMELVHKYNQLMKDFPLNELLSATDLDKIRESLHMIFGHLNKKLKLSPYPIRRALPLVEAISKDLNDQLLKVLGSRRMMYMEYDDFERTTAGAETVFHTWDDLIKEFTNVARDVTRKRSEKFLPIKINPAHAKLQERVNFVRAFRKQHEQLHQTIVRVMTSPRAKKATVIVDGQVKSVVEEEESVSISDINAVEEVKLAYESVKNIDVLDVSLEGTEIWIQAETAYNERVSRVENQIIARLRDRLGTAKSANEMFRVFSKFNALFVRPKIRGAIQEYQTQLIDSVKEDINKLHDKFKMQYRNSEAYHMAQLRDLPPISGTIIWARQIDRQLSLYMKRVEDVLGKGWELYAEGQKLQFESSSFRKKLDTRLIYDNWLQEITKRDLSVSGRIFEITRNRVQKNALQLGVNFDGQIITLFKEVRNLLWLNFQVPHTISNVAKDAKRVYPFAVSLMETVRTFSQTVHKVNRNQEIASLVAGYRHEVHTMISKGINLRWDYFVNTYDAHHRPLSFMTGTPLDTRENRHVMFVREFANVVSVFQDKVDALIGYYDEISKSIDEMKTCSYQSKRFEEVLGRIQKLIDRLNLESYSNLDQWVAGLDKRIEAVLVTRLQQAIRSWTNTFQGMTAEDAVVPEASASKSRRNKRKIGRDSVIAVIADKSNAQQQKSVVEVNPALQTLVHEIRIKNQVMYLDPPIEQARTSWWFQLHDWLAVVCHLPRIQSSRYEGGLSVKDNPTVEKTYSSLLTRMGDGSLENAYQIIEDKIRQVSDYVNIWLQYQSLWDLESSHVFSILEDDLGKWQQILLEIKKARSTFDNSETGQSFGPLVVDYEQVQSKVNQKYDQWQREILNKFGTLLGTSMKDFHASVSKARYELEQQSIESNSTGEAVTFITFVQDLKRKVAKWSQDVELFRQGQKTLERQRFQFPSDWVYVDQVDGEWIAFNEILSRKNNAIQEQIAGLQMKIVAEDKVVEQKIRDICAEWERTKPVQGDIKPDIATNTLSIFEGRVTRLKEEYDMVCRAKEALDLEQTTDDRLDPVLEELRDLKSVWAALARVWQSVYEIRDTPWTSVVPRKVRQHIDELVNSTKEMPNRMRQYAAYEYMQDTLRQLLRVNPLVADLKSEALRERHWRQIFKSLRVEGRFTLSEMTIGHLWDLDLKRNETVIKDAILQAQGEMALEEFLKQIKETWTGYVLDLVNYQNRCRLIRGWDDLFNKSSEHLNSLTAMKLSPYYKVFEEDASAWEDKLNRIHVLFDVWIDVQRQWVYLEGIFSGSVDIKHLLPVETSRFQSINTEFLTVMKKVYKSPFVLDVLNIPNIQKSLERLADLLSKIQKALGEYLERERSSFPRFYFVGDEDLLEIIGNSKDILRIQKHFKKMFAGIATILLDEEHTSIIGMASKEGEEVMFKTPVSIKDNPKINDWLTLLEKEMRVSLALLLKDAVTELDIIYNAEEMSSPEFMEWIDRYPAQLVVLAAQIIWTQSVDKALNTISESASGDLEPLSSSVTLIERNLNILADAVLLDLQVIKRRKCEHLVTELVHQRDVTRQLVADNISSPKDFSWLYQMRFYFNHSIEDPLQRLTINMANAQFFYGFEYLGVVDRLVQTPLTDRCYLTLTQALEQRLGGSPFGPAGTGKTESVKALGVQLGRFVLVFCCDETFDFQAMGRIFIGLCQVGAWGCFDEFNRLEERILSAVSQQVQTIQLGLKEATKNPNHEIEIVGRSVRVNTDTGIFITMNPGYAGRSNLPDNLKKLFRSMAMTKPDRELIAQVMLYSQGFRTAETLASKVVPLFNLCAEQLSPQSHYDFGLRALKSVLVSAGNLKRDRLATVRQAIQSGEAEKTEYATISESVPEQQLLISSIRETVEPKLVADDIPLLTSLLADVFPGVLYTPVNLDRLKDKLREVCEERRLVAGDAWMEKVIQLYQIQNIHHGLMMVGPSGSGKSSAWKTLLTALERVEGVEGIAYTIDPKAIPKDALYGTLDSTTREWTDGLFTHILRKIVDNVRGESQKRHWIIFDGDVDPEWVENLNSVLDDNRLLTLPNGERLNLPPNVRIMFEVETLKYATLATVSRCGMVWFSEDVITLPMIFSNYLETLRNVPMDEIEEEGPSPHHNADATNIVAEDGTVTSPNLATQRAIAAIMAVDLSDETCLVAKCLDYAATLEHIMDFTRMRVLSTFFSLLNKTVRNVLEYNSQHPDFPMTGDHLEGYITKRIIYSIIWSFSGDAKLELRTVLADFVRNVTTYELPPTGNGTSIIDYDIAVNTGAWIPWESKVPVIEIETHKVSEADIIIPTVDTIRHEEVLYSWLSEHKPLILCGPPGSGKTMTLFSALRKLPDMEVVGLNFSSATTPELILKTFEQHCEYRKTPNGVILSPTMIGRWLVVFCDEINLPATDKYFTQRVISFLRQLVEYNGFWRASDKAWVTLERIQFVGACNPPTDPGRVPLSHRFLRHAPLVMVDYAGQLSLMQIYGTFTRAMLKVVPNLRGYAEPLTAAMVELYLASQKRFTPDIQAHYIYSPRELTRWVRGIYEAIKPLETLTVEGLVRIWAHEALRLFQDRLVAEEERKWTSEMIDSIALKHFPAINQEEALERPILFSNWLSKHYVPVNREQLRDFAKARLKVFYEEELDVPLVLFNDVLEHVLRIDRVFRQPQGHLLLIGVSGSGKTTLSRFVAWMNGLSVFQIKVHNKYTGVDFDDDLRTVLRRAGCKGEKICFIMDESNVLDSGFLERMNTLLANAEVPGLFEGDEYASLMTACKEGAQRDGLMLDSNEELYKWFNQQVARNLHVVFTMNPPEGGLASRAATSPALFNRCVLDWFGDWPDQAFYQVGVEFTKTLDLDVPNFAPGINFPIVYRNLPLQPSHREAVVNALVYVHQSLYEINAKLSKRQGRHNYATPRHFLDFISHYVRLYNEKREDLEEQQRHLNVGLEKLKDTVIKVEELRKSLAIKKNQLELKQNQANEKIGQMIANEKVAEQKKADSLQIKENLKIQNKEIEARRAVVDTDLANAEPAVKEAEQSVKSIKRQHLTEVRAMSNPPEAVKLTMESVCIMLGHKIDSWKTVQSIIRRDDFISSIVNYNTELQITKQLRHYMRQNFLNNPNFDYEIVNRASKACGPLFKWVSAQVNFSEILDRVGPLREELNQLQKSSEDTKNQVVEIEQMISELEVSIARYKEEYAALVGETQLIKAEMERVKSKVDRSITLLSSLSSEKTRWEAASQAFESQMGTIVGDVLLAAAFLAYGGYFDQQYRGILLQKWMDHLSAANIQYKQEVSLTEYLSSADDRISWQANSLPADQLCVENAIMLKRFNRYPLIIDPSGQATNFLINEYKDRKITVTSFLDDSFIKNLESALRFGNPILIQDVEHLDPILNPVLNKELRRTGGRVLIRLGNQDIDFSPTFTLFLSTRDPSVNFAPDICSRVTFVNFTVTRGSLQSQCLNKVLKAERPDVDQKRTDLIKLQGEFQLKLRHLEKSLLQALNESKGNILDDDKVIDTLETLKKEAAEVSRKVDETNAIMLEVEQTTAIYTPLASACSSIFFVMEQLNLINHFYQFSLDFFYEIFEYVIHANPNLEGITDPNERLAILTRDLFSAAYKRASRTLVHEDHTMYALLLCQIRIRGLQEHMDETEYDFLLSGGDAVVGDNNRALDVNLPNFISDEVVQRIKEFTKLACFNKLADHIVANENDWRAFMEHTQPETAVPVCWEAADENRDLDSLRKMLVIKCFRPDRLLPATGIFATEIFNNEFMNTGELNLQKIVQEEVNSCTPLALCSVPGYDASYRVDNLVSETNMRCTSVAMGSAEGFALADQAISSAIKTGHWVMLKNVHLAPAWLGQLEKKLHSMKPNMNFRLFLTMETNPKVPANLQEALRSIPPSRLSRGPTERARLYFMLAWLHAVVQERLRYVPLGWTKVYEFNDSDQDSAFNTIDKWLDAASGGRANISPEKIPWDAIRSLLKQSIYGGRIDNEFDQRLLDSFVNTLFRPECYDIDFELVKGSGGNDSKRVVVPDGTKMEHFMEWVKNLPDREPPTWLGLPANAERVLLTMKGNNMLSKVRKMKSLSDDDELVYSSETNDTDAGNKQVESTAQPAWMRALSSSITTWLNLLPTNIKPMQKDGSVIMDPLFRFFERENLNARKLLSVIREDLTSLQKICNGELKQTNHLRRLLNWLNKGLIPEHWKLYKVPKSLSLNAWIADLKTRLDQVELLAYETAFDQIEISLGSLFTPEAYITATRQATAQRYKWSLEELVLDIDIDAIDQQQLSTLGYCIRGMKLEGASWENNELRLTSEPSTKLPKSIIRWIRKDERPDKENMVELPVYLNSDRSDLLFTISVAANSEEKDRIPQRAIAAIVSF